MILPRAPVELAEAIADMPCFSFPADTHSGDQVNTIIHFHVPPTRWESAT